jgi:hypothetical protein
MREWYKGWGSAGRSGGISQLQIINYSSDIHTFRCPISEQLVNDSNTSTCRSTLSTIHNMTTASPKPEITRNSSDATVSSTSSQRPTRATVTSTLKKPFQGWSKTALWAKEGLDDEYNFPTVGRRGC